MIARLIALAVALALAACASRPPLDPGPAPHAKIGAPYRINGKLYRPAHDPAYDRVGVASWYGDAFHGRATANGEIFDMNAVSAAHTTLPLPSFVEVENLENGRSIVVRVNDRGPFARNRIIDLSRAAARALDFERQGVARVRVRYVGPAPLPGEPEATRYARAPEPRAVRPALAPMIAAAPSMKPIAATPTPAPRLKPEAAPTQFVIALIEIADLSEMPSIDAVAAPFEEVRLAPLTDGAHQIELGPYGDFEIAAARLSQLREAGYPDAYITEAGFATAYAPY